MSTISSLFIIGNGFDLSHGMPTSFIDFRNYMQNRYTIEEHSLFSYPQAITDNHGEICYNEHEVADFFFNVFNQSMDDKWSEFEASLVHLNFSDCLSEAVFDRADGEENILKTSYNNSDIAGSIESSICYINKFFTEWIYSIDIAKDKKLEFNKLLVDARSIMSFNYTNTLEYLYGVDNICHIHGKVGEKLIFGHGDDNDYTDDYMQRNIGTEYSFANIDLILRKDVDGAMRAHQDFFEKMDKNIDKVYSYGFSYSNIDIPYIKKILHIINSSDVVWYFTEYDMKNSGLIYRKKLFDLGYIGSFDVFNPQ